MLLKKKISQSLNRDTVIILELSFCKFSKEEICQSQGYNLSYQ